jgi:hypothetical protein
MEAMTLPRELREGSRASGKALLYVHEKMGTPFAGLYRKRIHEGDAFGHLAVIQGLLLGNLGLILRPPSAYPHIPPAWAFWGRPSASDGWDPSRANVSFRRSGP